MSIELSHPTEALVSRRAALVAFGVLAVEVAAGCSFADPSESMNEPGITDPFCAPAEAAREEAEYPDTFTDARAEKVATDLQITPGSYFKLTGAEVKAVNDAGHFRTKEWIAPIFPPAVTKHSKSFLKAAEEFDIPVNALVSLATIESAGNTGAASGMDAHGIIQVVPRYHRERIDRLSGETFSSDEEQGDKERGEFLRTHPDVCIRAGAEYFSECIQNAKNDMSELRQDSMVIYARAAAAYNGGPQRAGQPFNELPLESQLYVNHVARLTLDVAVAGKLKENGMSNDEILRSMQSLEMNARAFAYDEYERGSSDIRLYELSAELCGMPEPGIDPITGNIEDQTINNKYHSYKDTCKTGNPWKAPATPGLRIWLVGGGTSLFLQSPENEAWRLPN